MQRKEGEWCPLIRKDCVQFKCKFWTKLVGDHPQIAGQKIDEYDCAVKWIPMLMIENTKEAIGVTSSINSFRNQMVLGQNAVLQTAVKERVKEITDARDNYS